MNPTSQRPRDAAPAASAAGGIDRRRLLACALAGAAAGLHGGAALAQGGDGRPVRLILPLSTGSTVDVVARAMSNPLSQAFGAPVVIENIPGAGGISGTTQLVRAPKDGHTLAMVSSNHVINPSIYKSMPYDSLKDITPICVLGTVPLALVVHPSVPARTTQELVALLKAHPGKYNFGSAGNGGVLHLAGEMFKSQAGVDIRHVPYRGTGPLVVDVVGGQVEMAVVSVTAVAAHIKAGKLVGIGVSTPKRVPILPDVPTLAESGLPNYAIDSWIALIGPAGLPPALVEKSYQAVKATLAQKEVQDVFAQQGLVITNGTPAQAAPFFKAEYEKHARLVKLSGATAD
ncbi:MAG: tripartite tricarboxylate transporter substrate binding protein [Xylophilus ampelinus]